MFRIILLFLLAPIAALAATHAVRVGRIGIRFVPHTIHAAPGDEVHFMYYPGDHGVAEGSYESPCHPKPDGFWSGFVDTKSRPAKEEFILTINDTKPIFIYCPNSDLHCQFGMNMVINPGEGKTLGNYRSRAATTKSIVPPNIQGGTFRGHKQ